ncbi:hypothetical protein F511_23833 [Dorcoceras hygrometricum]|uniref:Uncharacterized protein n=1 Tax=Dorcoceras hygrometricum TaxID=472368 RepID=A0A2Z7D1G7_9LAMI|nr:hypothetical protein F511_23833 [Dorcoceras hygrometricum]
MHTSRNCVTNYIHKFNVIVLGRELCWKGFDSLTLQFRTSLVFVLFNSCSLGCCLFFVTTLRATVVSLSTGYFAPGCHASLILLFLRLDTMSTGYAIELKLTTGSTVARDWYIILRLDAYQQLLVVQSLVVKSLRLDFRTTALQLLYRSSSNLRLFSASVPAGPFAPADLSSSAEQDVVTNDIIIDGPLRCSTWFSFDVPADPSSSSSACSWFLSYQLIHYAPAGSTWTLPDFEHLT